MNLRHLFEKKELWKIIQQGKSLRKDWLYSLIIQQTGVLKYVCAHTKKEVLDYSFNVIHLTCYNSLRLPKAMFNREHLQNFKSPNVSRRGLDFIPLHLPYMRHYNPLLIWHHSWLQTADFIEEFPCLVHKLSVILTTLDYKPKWKLG